MAKSRGRKFAEITSPTSGVFDLTSVPTITNAKLQNSAMTLAGSSVSLGGTGVADTDALSEGSSNLYFTDARVQTFLGGGTLAGNVVVPDNRSIYVGSSSDFRIVHNTTNTQLVNATGALQVTSNGGFDVTGAATFSSTIAASGNIGVTKETPVITLTDSSASRTIQLIADDNNSVVRASGPLLLQSGGAVSAITLDASRNATFSGNLTVSTSSGTALTLSGDFPRLYFVDTAGSDLDAYIVNNANGLFFGKTNSPTSSNDVMMLDLTNQRVGIGQSTPLAPLEIKSTDDPLLILHHTEASDNAAMHFKHGGTTNGHIYVNNDRTMYFSTVATNPAMVIKVGGNVGIGTGTGATADYRLHLVDTIADQDPILYAAASGTPANAFNWIAEFMAPNIAQDKRVTLALGKARSSNNSVTMSYVQRADTNNNALTFGHFGNNDLVSFCYNGNVGIGTTTPNQIFHIKNTGQHTTMRIENDNADFLIQAGDAGDDGLHFYDLTNTSYRMTIDNAGQVGIGITSPTAKLQVYDGGIAITTISGSGGQYFSLDNTHTGGRHYALVSTNDSHGSLGGGDFAIIDFDASGNDAARTRLLIDSSGNVGIGTASPSFTALSGSTSQKGLHIQNSGNDTSAHLKLTAHNNTGTPGQATDFEIIHKGDALKTHFRHGGADVLTIDSANKVGIGTTGPASKLHTYNLSAEDWRFENGTSGTTGKIYLKTRDNSDLSKYIMMSGYWTEVGVHNNEGFRIRGSDGNIKLTLTGAAGNLSVAGSGSDRNFKKDIKDIDTAIDIVKAAKPKTFEFIKHVKRKAAGFIAQDMQEILPDLVSGEEYDEEIESSGLGFDYIGYTAYLTKALQESIARIEALEAEVKALKE